LLQVDKLIVFFIFIFIFYEQDMALSSFFETVETSLVTCLLRYTKKASESNSFETRDVRELLKLVQNDLQSKSSTLKPLFPQVLPAHFGLMQQVLNRFHHKGIQSKTLRA
jgi:hypothetical protein